MVKFCAFSLIVLLILAVVGHFQLIPNNQKPKVNPKIDHHDTNGATAFVLVHGLGGPKSQTDLREALLDKGDILRLEFKPVANVDPNSLADAFAQEIAKFYDSNRHQKIVLVGTSMGALMVRRALLNAESDKQAWPAAVKRVVLMAGLNRGWDISGHRPVDMRRSTWFSIWIGSWFGKFVGYGQLPLSMESGTPFVANLRLDWMARMRNAGAAEIEVVQLLGDIDDIVSEEDNIDLAHVESDKFSWIRVRGTGHGNIADFRDNNEYGGLAIGQYRKDKFTLAATGNIHELRAQNVVQAFKPDRDVTDVVFVLHGIRDLGEWASTMEHDLRKEYQDACNPTANRKCKLAIESSRYGYFGMGPFLLKPNRDKYVKWFMDEYTNVRAMYPNAENIHFFGHSNGTYLFAAALDRYTSLKIDRAVFAGSIVRQDYEWKKMIDRDQVDEVLNYQAHFDWVVATFPRFFEFGFTYGLLKNDIGSAGFDGFLNTPEGVQNVSYIKGSHGAFGHRNAEIARFIFSGSKAMDSIQGDRKEANLPAKLSWYGANNVVLLILVIVVCFVGWRIFASSTGVRWPMLVTYFGLLWVVLRDA